MQKPGADGDQISVGEIMGREDASEPFEPEFGRTTWEVVYF